MKAEANTLEELFVAADEREPDMRRLDALIRETVPELAADRQFYDMGSMNMIAYGMYHYQYASGKEGDWMAVALANQKNYISLYVCAVAGDSYMAEAYNKRLGKVSVGKSCIRFKKIDDLNLDELAQLLRETEQWWRQQPKPTS